MHENRGNQMMTGFVLGAAVGAGIALLLAPCSGEETRHQLGEAANRLRAGAQHRLDDVKHAFRQGAKDVGEAVAAGRDAYANRRPAVEAPLTREAV